MRIVRDGNQVVGISPFVVLAFSLFGLLARVPAAYGQRLVNVTVNAGITYMANTTDSTPMGGMAGGAAAGDYDNDGYVDLYVTRNDGPDILYRNNRDGTFSDVTSVTFGSQMQSLKTNGAVWGDIDNDGDKDLYVTGWRESNNMLYINEGGTFTEQGLLRGASVMPGTLRTAVSATFGDYDNDGYLDLYTTEWMNGRSGPTHSRLLKNAGHSNPGYFVDVTEAAGVGLPAPTNTFAPRFTDLDRDGHMDLAIASDFGTSRLYWNNGNGTFTERTAASGIIGDRSAMGSALGDIDGDGDLDWFLGNIDSDGNVLFRNQLAQGQPRQFSEGAAANGVRTSGWSWGSSFFELENDGDLDLIVTNGFEQFYRNDPVYLFENAGNGTPLFTDVSASQLSPRDTGIGSGLLVMDYDRDGDQDVFIVNGGRNTPPVLYRNRTDGAASYLQIETIGTVSNRDGFGAFITVIPDDTNPAAKLVWEMNAGSNFLGQSENVAHFGLGGNTTTVDTIRIEWPSGIVQELHDVALNQRLTVTELVPEPIGFGFMLGTICLLSVRLREKKQ
jgi:enediyne biosynthesis protein E4